MAENKFTGDTEVLGNFSATTMVLPASSVSNSQVMSNAAIARSKLAQDANAIYTIPATAWRIHDSLATSLPDTSSGNDLGCVGGTFSTNTPSLQTADLKAAGATNNYARLLFALPPEYDSGQTITLRLHCAMLTTVADNSATIDVECYKSNKECGLGSDLCSTAAQDMNSLAWADKDFTINPSGFVAGDLLDIRITSAVNDATTGTAVIACIGYTAMLLDIKG